MADTGEDREIKQRVNAHQAEVVRESNQLEQRNRRGRRQKDARRDIPKRSPVRSQSCVHRRIRRHRQIHKRTAATGAHITHRSFRPCAPVHSRTEQPNLRLPSLSRRLALLRTSQLRAIQAGVPFLPKACKRVLPRTRADLHRQSRQ